MGKEQLFRLVVQTELAFFPARCIFPARNIFCHHLRKKFQLNRFLEEGSVQLLPADQTYQVKSDQIRCNRSNLSSFSPSSLLLTKQCKFSIRTTSGQEPAVNDLFNASVPNMCNFSAQVNFKKLETSVSNLVRDICTWQHNGDKSVVDAVFAK